MKRASDEMKADSGTVTCHVCGEELDSSNFRVDGGVSVVECSVGHRRVRSKQRAALGIVPIGCSGLIELEGDVC